MFYLLYVCVVSVALPFAQVISYTSGQIGLGSAEFRKRVGFALSMPSTNLSIYINNTQESDSGRYLCNVIIPGAPGLSGELRLNVKGTGSLFFLIPLFRKRGNLKTQLFTFY